MGNAMASTRALGYLTAILTRVARMRPQSRNPYRQLEVGETGAGPAPRRYNRRAVRETTYPAHPHGV